MALTFTHATKRISVPQLDAQPLLMQTLINAIRDEEASERGITYDQIADASGKEALGGGVFTAITVQLLSTWALEFAAGAYQAAVDGGNLADGLTRIANTGSPQVLLRSSAAATLVTGGGGGSAPTAGQNAEAVWTHATAALLMKLQRNKQVTDPVTGKITVYDDDGVTPLLQANLYEDAAGSQPYRGKGAERRDKLA